MSAVQKTNDSRQARSDATKHALMRAAERLIARCGMENVSISDIVVAAEQKNQSALQYHFTNLSGLIDALWATKTFPTTSIDDQMLLYSIGSLGFRAPENTPGTP